MASYVLFGGTGFIGTHLARNFTEKDPNVRVFLCDIRPMKGEQIDNVEYVECDVRKSINDPKLLKLKPDWIFNLAAVHREPGHKAIEYFETNIPGAENVNEYAEKTGCNKIYFTSSIAVYGPCHSSTNEQKLPQPITPYGGSKYPAELIHIKWQEKQKNRRLIISRPGVVYGPGDPGNIMRMIKAIDKGYFFFPGSKNIYKSYAYIYGFIESIEFTMAQQEKLILYNYVEHPTETIGQIAEIVKNFLHRKTPIISLSKRLLVPVSWLMQAFFGKKNPIHPIRVKKASLPTHIVPQYLIDNNFNFKYDFKASLEHWKSVKPDDFA